MVLGEPTKCSACDSEESAIWQKNEEGNILCLKCFPIEKNDPKEELIEKKTSEDNIEVVVNDITDDKASSTSGAKEDITEIESESNKTVEKRETRPRKTRKAKQNAKTNTLKGKGRRHIFKKTVYKSPASVATPVTKTSIFYDGKYFQIGDIVALTDVRGGTFYAQITGLLMDQFCEKSATISWLLPTTKAPPPEEKFDPAAYVIGPEECVPRKLEFMDFVCRAPSNYYKDKYSPYPTYNLNNDKNSLWVTMGPVPRPKTST